ncbi:MAG: hypothetical protein M1825_006528 [Sarcosagium campestre]|nr:MAG: hypothetical protein M1825_006528 [Sarcosagium campestre]
MLQEAFRRHSRRSQASLNQLSLTSLTHIPLTDEPSPTSTTPKHTYLQGRSAPTTPGILSRSPSSTRLQRTSTQPTQPRQPGAKDVAGSRIPKSKSSSYLLRTSTNTSRAGRNRPTPPKTTTSSGTTSPRVEPEWLLRAAMRTTDDVRASKGQSWLLRRASSTSLVDVGSDDEIQPALSARASRPSSKSDLRPRTRGSRPASGIFGDAAWSGPGRSGAGGVRKFEAEPNFVDAFEDGIHVDDDDGDYDDDDAEDGVIVDEAEMSRLTRERGFGMGGWVDRLVGWTLFEVSDDDDADDDNDDDNGRMRAVGTRPDKESNHDADQDNDGLGKRRVRRESDRVVVRDIPPPPSSSNAAVEEYGRDSDGPDDLTEGHDDGGWADAAWLLSVAAKILT